MVLCFLKSCEAETRLFLVFSSHRQSSTGSVVVTATGATSPLSEITSKTNV